MLTKKKRSKTKLVKNVILGVWAVLMIATISPYAIGASCATYIVAQDGTGDYNGNTVTAIQNAIDAVVNKGYGGGKVVIKEGVYTISVPIDVSGVDNLTIEGMGEGTVLVVPDTGQGTTNSILSISNIRRCKFSNMKMWVAYHASSYSWSIVMGSDNYLEDILFENVHFVGDGSDYASSQPYMINFGADYIKRLTFSHCYFENSGFYGDQVGGLIVRGFNGLTIDNCRFRNVNNPIIPESTTLKYGLVYTNNHEVVDNTGFHAEGSDIWATIGVMYKGNVQTNLGSYPSYTSCMDPSAKSCGGLMIEKGCKDVVVSGNVFKRNPVQLVPHPSNSSLPIKNVIVSDNVIETDRCAGIWIYADNYGLSTARVENNMITVTDQGITPILTESGWTSGFLVVSENSTF